MLTSLAGQYAGICQRAGRFFQPDICGLAARAVFAAVLAHYFLGSALSKLDGNSWLGIDDSAYFQILPTIVEFYGHDTGRIPFWPYGLTVAAGTLAELILPLLIVLGLVTRLAALGMIIFVAVQTYVDVYQFNLADEAVGAWFDRFPNAEIADQRIFWIMLFGIIMAIGPGKFSLDGLFHLDNNGKS